MSPLEVLRVGWPLAGALLVVATAIVIIPLLSLLPVGWQIAGLARLHRWVDGATERLAAVRINTEDREVGRWNGETR